MIFKKVNAVLGWLVFSVSLTIYFRTIEPTVSFWDCGEFIACADKLEVGHQPGAPLFLLLGRLFSLFALNDSSQVARMVNSLSAVSSAFSIMFLFLTITHLARKMVQKTGELSGNNMIGIFTGGVIGSLACAFSDTFWFSAVEGEVYATSSFFTAVVFWSMLKWEESFGRSENADRWLVLIAYLTGLSVGVHLLNLLTIPALVLIYYYRKCKRGRTGFIVAITVSLMLVGFIAFGYIPGMIQLAAWCDLLFVNGFGLPLNSGAIAFLGFMTIFIILALVYSHKYHKPVMNMVILSFTMLFIGYSSYVLLAIRADANPPVNLNRVNNPFSLLGYIIREQYIIRPVIRGPYYNTRVTGYKTNFTYVPENGRYKKKETNGHYTYDKASLTWFPRMSSTDPNDIAAYKRWADIRGSKPTFHENLRFFFRYQVGFMYVRYFMWNFSGRQNENQGNGTIISGNWISGLPWMDEWRLGRQDNIPEPLRSNKGRNRYYLLPLLLGLLGLLYQLKRKPEDFTIVLFFFLFTGLAIVVYLNEVPLTPRERDYAVGGSFYVFCIWIGLGAMAFIEFINRKITANKGIICIASLAVLFIPALMAYENFDDHDRSRRCIARDFAYNYLNSCAPGAILFTNADNDTYPLWYAQEVEGIRTDIRVVLAPFLNADWYIHQLSDWYNEAAPVPLIIDPDKYNSGKLNYVPYYNRTDRAVNLKDIMEFLGSNDPRVMVKTPDGSEMNFYPTNRFRIPVQNDSITLDFTVSDKGLSKHNIAILDIIAANDWKRPVYFLSTQVPGELGLKDYLRQDGFAYRLVPEKYRPSGFGESGSIQADSMYEKLMHTFRWGNMNDPGIFMDYNSIRTTNILGIRSCFARLAEEYLKKENVFRAIEVLDRCMEIMPNEAVPYDIFMLPVLNAYYNAGAVEKADRILQQYRKVLKEEKEYYGTLKPRFVKDLDYEIRYNAYVMQQLDIMQNLVAGHPRN